MQDKVIQLMFRLLRFEVCGAECAEEIRDAFSKEDLPSLYTCAKRHDLAHLIADALDKLALLPFDGEISAKLRKQQMLAVYRQQRSQYELQVVCNALEEAKLPFIPLKGAIIRDYYPEPWMRTSCDIDILIREEDMARATKLLTDQMGYRKGVESPHDVSFHTESGIHIELHHTLTNDRITPEGGEILSNIWSFAEPEDGCEYRYRLSDAMFYFYHIAHMAKHIQIGGCGVRPFIDQWILEHCISHDNAERNALLAKGGLLTFAEAAQKLAEVWLADAEAEEMILWLESFILNGGVYGNMENRVSILQKKRGGKLRYAFSRIFISYDSLKFYYPILKKHRWLTPVYEVVRWFRLIFTGKTKVAVREFRTNQSTTDEKATDTVDILSKLGL